MKKQLPITTYGMDILRKKTKPVTKIDSKFIDLVQNMFYTMDRASGIGIQFYPTVTARIFRKKDV